MAAAAAANLEGQLRARRRRRRHLNRHRQVQHRPPSSSPRASPRSCPTTASPPTTSPTACARRRKHDRPPGLPLRTSSPPAAATSPPQPRHRFLPGHSAALSSAMVCRYTAASFSAEAASSPSTWDWSRHFKVDQDKPSRATQCYGICRRRQDAIEKLAPSSAFRGAFIGPNQDIIVGKYESALLCLGNLHCYFGHPKKAHRLLPRPRAGGRQLMFMTAVLYLFSEKMQNAWDND